MSEEQEALFVEQVKTSWKIHNEFHYAEHVDDVLLGAVIAGAVEVGYSLIDLNSDGTNHYLRFERLDDGTRLIFKLNHRTPDLARSKALGHLADITIGYGQKVDDVQSLWSSLKQELKSGFILETEPGIVTIDADLTAKYIYAQVSLIWSLDEYMSSHWQPNVEKVASSIDAARASLEKYLTGRLQMT